MMKKLTSLLLSAALLVGMLACGASAKTNTTVRVAGLKGPTTMGLVNLLAMEQNGTASQNYDLQLYGAADEVVPKLIKGEVDIAAIPANTGMLGGLCSYILYGEMSYAYVQIIGVFQNLLMFFVLFPMGYYYQHGGKDRNFFVFFKDNWKSIFINWNQLSVVALVIGTALHAAGIPRPAAGTTIFQALIHVSAWVALIPVGYLIDFSHFKDYARQTLDLIPIKMVLTPLASYFLALCFTSDPVLLGTIVIVMATPCAINALITERLYDLNVNLAMAPFITTQLLYILILYPAFYLLVSWGYLPFK